MFITCFRVVDFAVLVWIFCLLFFFLIQGMPLCIFQNKGKVVNMSVYAIAAIFTESTEIALYISLLVQQRVIQKNSCPKNI